MAGEDEMEHEATEAELYRRYGPRLSVENVRIHGNIRTKNEVFDNELQGVYSADRYVTILSEAEMAISELQDLGIFESVDFLLEKAKSGDKRKVDLSITVKEKGWRKIYIGANTDGSEEAAESSLQLTNAFGVAEQLTLSASYGRTGSNTERFSFTKPRAFFGLPLRFTASAANEMHNNVYLSSYSETVRGGYFSLSDYAGNHEVALNFALRDILPKRHFSVPTAFNASPSILSEANPSTKCSIKYTHTDDTRDSKIDPRSGSFRQFSTELAGLGALGLSLPGDVMFVKMEAISQKHFAFGPLFVDGKKFFNLSFSSAIGSIRSIGKDASRTSARLSDRFFLGGPLTVRGFHHKGIGPRASPVDGGSSEGDSLGGDVCYSMAAKLGFPFPFPILAMFGFRGHFYANAGNLTTWDHALDEKKWLKNLYDGTRVAVGFGLVWPTQIGRIEANYSWILRSQPHDTIRRGQLGLGFTFT